MMKSTIKSTQIFAACVVLTLLAVGGALAQEKPKPTSEPAQEDLQQITHAKVTVVFNEYQGEKKVSSLPYVMQVNAYPHGRHAVSLRMGLHVPIVVQVGPGPRNIQYQSLGTNLDCDLHPRDDGSFLLNLSAERNSVYAPERGKGFVEWHPGDQALPEEPIIDQLHVDPKLIIRDGQTQQAAMITDPVSGHVVKIDVTLNVEK